MSKQYLDKDGLQVAVDNVKEAKEIAAGAMALAQQAMESSGQDIYSTTETKTNKVWIDGKPIYRKVVDFGALPNATTKSVTHGIVGMTHLIRINVIAENTSGPYFLNIPYPDFSSTYTIRSTIDTTNVNIVTQYDFSSYNQTYVTLEYTK